MDFFFSRDSCGCELMVVGLIATYAISAHHNYSCEFELRSVEVQHCMIKFVSDLWQVGGFLRFLRQ